MKKKLTHTDLPIFHFVMLDYFAFFNRYGKRAKFKAVIITLLLLPPIFFLTGIVHQTIHGYEPSLAENLQFSILLTVGLPLFEIVMNVIAKFTGVWFINTYPFGYEDKIDEYNLYSSYPLSIISVLALVFGWLAVFG